jgi:hypothetical protein
MGAPGRFALLNQPSWLASVAYAMHARCPTSYALKARPFGLGHQPDAYDSSDSLALGLAEWNLS